MKARRDDRAQSFSLVTPAIMSPHPSDARARHCCRAQADELPYGKESANRNSQESFEGMCSADSDFVPLVLGLFGAPASRCHRQMLNQFGGRGIANNCGVIAWNISAAPSLS
jgi:hypothetical protein